MRLKNPNRWLRNETRRWTSLLKKYRDEKKTDEYFEVMLSNIPLEDIIALKLELSCKTLGSPVYGIPIWDNLKYIIQDAVLKFAISTTKTTSEAASFLGLSQRTLFRKTKRFGLWNYYDPVYLKERSKRLEEKKLKGMEQNNGPQTNSGNTETGS